MLDTAAQPAEKTSRMERINAFLDQYILPIPVKYLTNRITILVTLCLLVPLIVFANVEVFVLATNSYLNVMSVVVSSTVLLYSTISEKRDRLAAEQRERIAAQHQEMAEQRAQQDHEQLEQIRDELSQHVNEALANIQQILVERLERMQIEDHEHIEETHRAVIASTDAHREELAELRELVAALHADRFGKPNP
jgi:hypothetical protein